MLPNSFSIQHKEQLVYKIKKYFETELQSDIGAFDAEFLLEFFAKEIGGHFYNQGLQDAQKVLKEHFEALEDKIYSLEEIV